MLQDRDVCICLRPGTFRCSKCNLTSYCSQRCQSFHLRAHRNRCRSQDAMRNSNAAALQLVSSEPLIQLVLVATKIPSLARDLPQTGPSVYQQESNHSDCPVKSFWLLQSHDQYNRHALAESMNLKSREFWADVLAPITTNLGWIDVVLDTVFRRRLSTGYNLTVFEESKIYSAILAGVFPHLVHFTPAQNAKLLEIILSPQWSPTGTAPPVWKSGAVEFLLQEGITFLFGHGEPSHNFIKQLVHRCLGPSVRPFSELYTLLHYVAYPIQRNWPTVAGTHILDMLMLVYFTAGGKPVPYDTIFQFATTSPAACKRLMSTVVAICAQHPTLMAAGEFRVLLKTFRATFKRDQCSQLFMFMKAAFPEGSGVDIVQQLAPIMRGDGGPYQIYAADMDKRVIMTIALDAIARLGYPSIPGGGICIETPRSDYRPMLVELAANGVLMANM
ncbi:hypothetical protein R3P38DRAFT_2899533 [Favolaschia claudopus]|uniref:MYND-type domain-containing protein n=1 Tax=Favolaschia claudopus TaxID=2862362 RepID=A0AAW0CN39_9AGAR